MAVGKAARAVSPEFKGLTHRVVRIAPATYGEDYRPGAQQLLAAFDAVEALTADGDALAVSTLGYGCGAESLFKMCVGNRIGIELAADVDVDDLFTRLYGSFIVELAEDAELPEVADDVVVEPLGTTVEGYDLRHAAPRSSSSPSCRRPGRAASRACFLPQCRRDPRGRGHRLPCQDIPWTAAPRSPARA